MTLFTLTPSPPTFSGFGFVSHFPTPTQTDPNLTQTGQTLAWPVWQPDSPPEVKIENRSDLQVSSPFRSTF